MIINISGTGGSGKSHTVRSLMVCYDIREPLLIEGRKRPWAYICKNLSRTTDTVGGDNAKSLFVMGHYETPCGGCDTLATFFSERYIDQIYETVRKVSKDFNVIYEGLLIESDVRRRVELHQDGFPLTIISLDVSLEECLESTRKRRLAKGNDKPLNPKNTIERYKHAKRCMIRLKTAGVNVLHLDREAAFEKCLELLGLK